MPRISHLALTLLLCALGLSCATSGRMWRISPLGGEAEADRVNLWPLAYHNGTQTSILWPFYDVDDRGFALRPVVAKEGTGWTILWPFASFDTEKREGWIFPLYRFGESSGVFPVAGFGKTNYIGPVWWKREGSGHGVFPLYGNDLFGLGVDHVGPVWWGEGDEPTRRAGLFPLISFSRDGKHLHLLPLYTHDITEQFRTRTALCGLWIQHEEDDLRMRWLVPFYVHREAPGERDTALLPFYWKHTRDERSQVFTLLGHRFVAPDSTSFSLYPLWWSHTTPEQSWRMLFPFYYFGRRADERTLITPLGGRGWSATGEEAFVNVLGPLYHRSTSKRRDEERTAFLWPLFERHRRGEETTTRVAPFYSSTTSPGRSEAWFALGGGHRLRDEEGRSHRLWPFYSWSDHPVRPGVFYDLTLYGRQRRGNATFTRLFPVYARWKSDEVTTVESGLGLYHYRRDRTGPEERKEWWLWPIVSHRSGPPRSDVLALTTLVGNARWSDGRIFQLGASLLYRYQRQGDEVAWHGPLWLVRSKKTPDHRKFNFLYYAYRSETKGEYTTRDVFPFITWDSGPSESRFSFLWRLLHFARRGEHRGGHFLFIPWGDSRARRRSVDS